MDGAIAVLYCCGELKSSSLLFVAAVQLYHVLLCNAVQLYTHGGGLLCGWSYRCTAVLLWHCPTLTLARRRTLARSIAPLITRRHSRPCVVKAPSSIACRRSASAVLGNMVLQNHTNVLGARLLEACVHSFFPQIYESHLPYLLPPGVLADPTMCLYVPDTPLDLVEKKLFYSHSWIYLRLRWRNQTCLHYSGRTVGVCVGCRGAAFQQNRLEKYCV